MVPRRDWPPRIILKISLEHQPLIVETGPFWVVPPWMAGQERGWITAEYNMLPGSTSPRKRRDRGKVDEAVQKILRDCQTESWIVPRIEEEEEATLFDEEEPEEESDEAAEDDTLLRIWVDENLPHPKVDGPWTLDRARAWIARSFTGADGRPASPATAP